MKINNSQLKTLDIKLISLVSKDFINRFPLSKYNNLAGIISALGGNIVYKDFLKNSYNNKTLEVTKKGQFNIYIHVSCSFYSFAWSLCHELGHYVLHYLYQNFDNDDDLSSIKVNTPTANLEADIFAKKLISAYNLNLVPVSTRTKTISEGEDRKIFAY